MKFVIFHGAFGSPDGNWFPELKYNLEALDQEVIIPWFPTENWDEVTKKGRNFIPAKQILTNWLSTFEKVFKTLKKEEKFCFIGHSLGPLFILHVVEKFNIRLDSAIFVSPFFDRLNKVWQIDTVNDSFYKTDFDFEKLKKLIPVSYVLYSDNDPYVDKNHSLLFAKALDSSLIFVKRAGHINSEVNLNEFPLISDLCLSRIDLSMYQRYIHYRSERFATDLLKKNRFQEIHLKPEEIFDEGKFHFSNLSYSGFCTLFSWWPDWDPKNQYFEDCRKAARRVNNINRVFIIKNVNDLNRKVLREHVRLDLQGGIKVYFCMLEDLDVKVDGLDFGIWDLDYVCTIKYDSNNKMKEIILSSRKEDLERARKDEKLILSKSTRIHNVTSDIDNFIRAHDS